MQYIDQSKYNGDLVYTAVDTSQGFWMFTADSYSVGGKAGSGSISGIADTGTTLLLLDDSVVTAYYAQVSGSSNDATQGGYIFPCGNTLPDFSITVGGQVRTSKSLLTPMQFVEADTTKVPGSYMNYAPTDTTNVSCFGGVQSNSGIGMSIFGDIFLKSQYVVFDQTQGSPRIGFGQQ
jgi:aspergillopepsin I